MRDRRCAKIESLLPLHAGGDLTPRAARKVAAHLRFCRECRESAEEYGRSLRDLKATGPLAFDAQFFDELRGAVRSEIARQRGAEGSRPSQFISRLRSPRFALYALILSLGLAFYLTRHPRQEQGRREAAPGQEAPPVVNKLAPERRPLLARAEASRRPTRTARRLRGAPVTRAADARVARRDQETAAPVEAETQSAEPLRIEIQTSDPDIRIIWLASNDATK